MLGVPGLQIVVGQAPGTLPDGPAPDAIFVGGGVSEPELVPALWARLRPGGRLVANAVSTEGERALFDAQKRYGGALTRIAVGRAEPLGAHQAWRPLLPVTQLAATKPS
jgi:precorrin-6Y C5,15-methyltransferase (decarboxylating)